jgi:hypothetical protein
MDANNNDDDRSKQELIDRIETTVDMIELLLMLGAYIHVKDGWNSLPLHVCAKVSTLPGHRPAPARMCGHPASRSNHRSDSERGNHAAGARS